MVNIYFITQGCSANIADSEVMAGLLHEGGHEIVDCLDKSDLVIFNTCTVKGPTESFFIRKLKELKNKKVVVAGCIPQSQLIENYSTIGTYRIKNIVEVVEETLKGNVVSYLDKKDDGRLNLPKIRKNNLIEIVPLSQGCLNACTYCKTKQARGNLKSYLINDIVRHVSNAAKEGVKEVWLTSQDNSVYGFDIGTNLSELLKQIISIPQDFKIRVGMANPKHLLNFLDELIEIYKHDKIYKFLHVPIQSGSNKVLKGMKRGYVVDNFRKVIEKFKKEIPDITISTDIICGFPSETREDFNETIKLINEIRPDVINISRFWPRPGTIAAKMKQLCGREVKKRTREVTELFCKIAKENNQKWVGWKGNVLITEKGKNNFSLGRNYTYKQVVVKDDLGLGEKINVEIKSCTSFDLKTTS